ncbi:class I lanthipeptide [Chitinophaga vietnamensis]|uniref:class I lanthipeptide n=1 Tax=Chitinophaga vietnamensis TaxID=2593957 RepID=UPI001376477E|nr:class I lanthipeptide [Chitinophaga vietnamensis]
MKKKVNLTKLSLSKKTLAHLSAQQQDGVAGGKLFSDPLTENPCDPTPSMIYCATRKSC